MEMKVHRVYDVYADDELSKELDAELIILLLKNKKSQLKRWLMIALVKLVLKRRRPRLRQIMGL